MKHVKQFPILLALAALAMSASVYAQQTDNSNKPTVVVGNDLPKNAKPGTTRTIQGLVKDASDNPAKGAIVQLKNLRNAKVIDFITKDDGKFAFRDLSLDIEYELLAKRGEITTPVKKASPYDSRHIITLNFKLEPPEKEPPAEKKP